MLLDPRFPAMRFLGVEPDIPIFAEQLIEAGRLEPLAIARAQHGPGRQAPYAPRREQSLSAIAVVIVIADPAVERQPIERLRKRSEEHTSELQSLMRISYAVFCL